MKAIIVEKPGNVVVRDVPDIEKVPEYGAICRNLFASTCSGTDKKLIDDSTPWDNQYPSVLGHENVGEVVQVGPKARNLKVGDLVLRPVYVYAGETRNGYHALFGGFSEFGVILDAAAMREDGLNDYNPYANYQMKIPGSWRGDPSAVMFITLKETFSWLRRLGSLYGKNVGVVGVGAVGLFYVKLASIFCARGVTALARTSARSDLALKAGADRFVALSSQDKLEGEFDLLIDAAGVLGSAATFIPMIRPGGTFAFYGLDDTFAANFDGFGSGLTFAFHGSDEGNPLVHETCVSLVEKRIVKLSEFHSSVMSLDDAPKAYDLLREKKEFKVVFQV